MGYLSKGDRITSSEQDIIDIIGNLGTALNVLRVNAAGTSVEYASSGSGTVTTVSVTTANGVSGTVATATTTPAITLTLGSITPSAVQISGLTASEIVITDASKNLASAAVATYPSLTELTYVKGVTSALQTQIDGKAATGQTFYIGTTQVAINRASAALTLAGITLTTPDIGTPSAGVLTNVSGTAASLTAGLATSLAGGSGGTIPYQSAAGTTAMLANGTAGQVLQSNGTTLAPSWVAAGAGDMILASIQTVTGAKTFGSAGAVGKLLIAGTTSGAVTLDAAAVAGTAILTLQGTTGTIYSTGGTDVAVADGGTGGSTASITLFNNITGYTASGATGTTSTNLVFSTSPTFITPTLGVASSTSLATSAATPLLLTNGQLVNIALTSQTVAATTLTIPNFASVVDTFAFITLAQTLSNKTFVAPALGTPASGTLTNCTFPTLNQNTTGSAASLSVSGQTGLITLTGTLATSRIKTVRDAADTILELGGSYTPAGTWTSLTMVTPVLGTPTSGTLTNCTGLPAASVLAGSFGAGAFVISTSLQAATIELGHATDTTLSRSAAGVLAVEGVVIPSISSTNTLTNKQITPRIVSAASYTTDTGTSLNMDNLDIFVITAQAGALLFNSPGGTLVQGQSLVIRIKDNATARALTWNAVFRAMGTALPSTTVLSKTLYLGFFYNSTDTKWDLVASAQEA